MGFVKMKIILILTVCSFATGECMPPLQWHETFEDPYSCSITGYKEGLKKLEEIGKEEVNKLALSITFSCRTYPGATT